jgi:hypothetical protein
MYREALFGLVIVAILFVPVFVAVFVAVPRAAQMRTARERRIALYRRSSESRLLNLNDPVRS